MKLLYVCISLFCTLALVGCVSPPLSRSQADLIKQGEDRAQTTQRFGKSEAAVSHVFESQNKKYLAEHYALQTGSKQSGMVVCTPACMWIPTTVPVLTPFVVVYTETDKKVRASGTLEELSKSENSEVAGFMPELKDSYAKALAAKKAK